MHGTRPNRTFTSGLRAGRRLAAVLICLAGLAAAGAGAQDRSTAGRLLVASESMGDPRFSETVIYMIEHDPKGALGLVVNRPVGAMPVAVLLEGLGLDTEEIRGDIPVYSGGPVEPGRGFVLHSTDVMAESSEATGTGFAVSASPNILRLIGRGEGPEHSLFAFGYAGWGPGQLDGELARADWFVIPAETDLVFAPDPAASWRRAVDLRGVEL